MPNRLTSKDRQSIAAGDPQRNTINSNGNHKDGHHQKSQKRQQLSHNGTAMEKHRENGLKHGSKAKDFSAVAGQVTG